MQLGHHDLGDLAHGLLAHAPEAPPGDRVHRALALRELLDALIAQAVVAEREEGATWTDIGAAAGITRQSAHGRWDHHVTAWAAAGRRALKSSSGLTVLDAAAGLDHAYARLHDDHPRDAFSRTLDAVRFPGAEATERARRERTAALLQRLAVLHAAHRDLMAEFTPLRTAPERAELLRRQADLETERADLADELAEIDPDHAADHRARARESRTAADNAAGFADLLSRPRPESDHFSDVP